MSTVRREPLAQQVASLMRRIGRLERSTGVEVLQPVPIGGTTATAAGYARLWAALSTSVGTTQTWVVLVRGTATTTLRLTDDAGAVGAEVTQAGEGYVTVQMSSGEWRQGQTRMVWLEALTASGTATVWPVRAVGA